MFDKTIKISTYILFAGNATSDLIVSNKSVNFTIAHFKHEPALTSFLTTGQHQGISHDGTTSRYSSQAFQQAIKICLILIHSTDKQFTNS